LTKTENRVINTLLFRFLEVNIVKFTFALKVTFVIVAGLIIIASPKVSALTVKETFGFKLSNVSFDHFWRKSQINEVVVSLQYKKGILNSEYPNIVEVEGFLRSYLKEYPQQDDYWEIVNKNLSIALLNKFKMIDKITIFMTMPAGGNTPYPRVSEVTIER
jgi:hypothetical protein